jgi:hypothetical protein
MANKREFSMAKLTLFFNRRPIEVFHLEENESTIGRDSENTFVIDSLAIATTHLKITSIADKYFVESTSEQFPTLINNQPITRQALNQGDEVTLGKHTLTYSASVEPVFNENDTSPTSSNRAAPSSSAGNLQVMSGPDIGLVISLNKPVTELNIGNSTPAIIAKRQHGYYISRLDDDISIKIDDIAISAETQLNNNCKVNIGDTKYTFFTE